MTKQTQQVVIICLYVLYVYTYTYICIYVRMCVTNKKEKGAINFGGSKGNMGRVKKKKGKREVM